jgi:hypothetical protein
LIVIEPNAALSAATDSAVVALLNRGGTAFFLGDNFIFDASNTLINDDLAAIGSSLRIVLNALQTLDELDEPAIVEPDPLTAGVTNFTNVSGSPVSGGTPLFLSNDGRTLELPFVEDQTLGGTGTGSIPEPPSAALLICGLVGLALGRRIRPRSRP